MPSIKTLALALATIALSASPLAASAQIVQPAASASVSASALSATQRALLQTEIAALLLQVQRLEQELAAIQSQTTAVVVTASSTATTTPGTAPVAASTTPSSATVHPIITVSVNGTTFSHGQPMTVTWSTNVAIGVDSTRLPYLEFFPYGANPIIVPSVRVARPPISATSYVWFVSPNGILGDTVTAGKYLVQIGLYDPSLQTYILGATQPVTINP